MTNQTSKTKRTSQTKRHQLLTVQEAYAMGIEPLGDLFYQSAYDYFKACLKNVDEDVDEFPFRFNEPEYPNLYRVVFNKN